jgi:hypothetical protein
VSFFVVDLRHIKEPSGMNRTSNVRKQNSSGHFSPKSPDCLPDGSGILIRIEQKLVRSVSRSLTTECTLTDQETFGMKYQKRRRIWPTPGCKAMEEEEDKTIKDFGICFNTKGLFDSKNS